MSKAFSNLLKHIGKLSHTEKERVSKGQTFVEPTSSIGGRLINEMREIHFKEGFECPHCVSEYIVRFGKYNGRQPIFVSVVVRPLLIKLIRFYTVLEKVTNGLRLLIVCSKANPSENLLKS